MDGGTDGEAAQQHRSHLEAASCATHVPWLNGHVPTCYPVQGGSQQDGGSEHDTVVRHAQALSWQLGGQLADGVQTGAGSKRQGSQVQQTPLQTSAQHLCCCIICSAQERQCYCMTWDCTGWTALMSRDSYND